MGIASALEKDRSRALHLAMLEIKRATEIEKIETATETKTGIEIEIEIVTETVTATAIGIETAIEGEEILRAKGGTRMARIRTIRIEIDETKKLIEIRVEIKAKSALRTRKKAIEI